MNSCNSSLHTHTHTIHTYIIAVCKTNCYSRIIQRLSIYIYIYIGLVEGLTCLGLYNKIRSFPLHNYNRETYFIKEFL
jgi:hypothetical protein